MENQGIANIFYELADYLEMEEIKFKPYAYQKAALNVEALEQDVKEIYEKGGLKALEKIPGVGKNIAEKIEEYLKTGKIKYYEEFKKKIPVDIRELSAIEGIGPKKIKILYQKLGIKNLKDLEKAAKEHKITHLFGFGEKTEKNILDSVAFLKKSATRFLLADILPKAKNVCEKLKNLKEVDEVSFAGSVRRMKETIGDIDFLVISKNPQKVMDFFCSLPGIIKILAKGLTKASIKMKEGYDMDIRILPEKSYGAALQYFTGSKEHNIILRKIAINKGLKLSEYGLFKGQKMIAGENEQGIYEALGMNWIPPEIRENQGEIEAALAHKLPKLIELKDIKGDLHVHSHWNIGKNPIKKIEELAEKSMKMGYQYLGISDHTKFLKIEHGLNEKELENQKKEIDKINSKFKTQNSKLKILQGCEVNILADGSIDIKDETLAKMDYVIAGVHSQLKMKKQKMTNRIIKAMRNPNIDVISHLFGRIIFQRDECKIDFDKILRVAKETNTILEINACPVRLDLKDINIKKAKEMGVKMIIGADAHQLDQLGFMEFGVSQARRGWAEKKDIVNCNPLENLLKFLK